MPSREEAGMPSAQSTRGGQMYGRRTPLEKRPSAEGRFCTPAAAIKSRKELRVTPFCALLMSISKDAKRLW